MAWFQSTDTALFRFINQSLANPALDWLMPMLAGNALFVPLLLAVGVGLLWKGGRRVRVFVVALVLAVALSDGLVCNPLKKAVGRPRPCVTLQDARTLVGCSQVGSLPSAHAANWFAATAVVFVFYRRRTWLVGGMATAVAFSRVYDGVHYPGDVLAGAVLGAGTGFATVSLLDAAWRWLGRKWFPLWWGRLPSVTSPEACGESLPASQETADAQWLRLGYLLIGALLVFRLGYLASGTISLSEDEAYQWLWSKHLALSYFSKPPGIALIQFAGTHLWGDTEFGVRFFSPVFAAVLSLVLLRFLAREASARQGFLLLLVVTATPLMSVGTILMTIDPPLVLCWTLAMVAGWRAAKPDGETKHWLRTGWWLGLGFLCKYSAAYQVLCWALFFALWKPVRIHLRKPGPYLALLIFAGCTLPVVIWNAQHGWITALHVAGNASLDKEWQPTLRYFWEFLGSELGLLNPVFLVAAVWAMFAVWQRRRERPLWLFFFCMGAPVLLGHLAYSLRSRIQPNWIAPAVLPLFCLMVVYWDARWREGSRAVKRWAAAGLGLGLFAIVLMHESNLIGKLAGRKLPGELDPLRRVRAWKEAAVIVETARRRLEAKGRPAFIIANHYGPTALFTFYLPTARQTALPLVYPRSSPDPKNQFWFWPEYRYVTHRRGQNAIYADEISKYPLESGWFWKWLKGAPVGYAPAPPHKPPPASLIREFETVTSLGEFEVTSDGRVFRRLRLFECRQLR